MKKILLFLLIFISVRTFGQYPTPQNLGSDSTLVTSKGGFKGRIIVWAYTDTASANLQRISQYPYALIATGDHNLWIRNITATAWTLIGTSSGTAGLDTVYVKDDLTVDTTTNPGHQTIGRLHDNGVISGGTVTVDSCRTLDIPATSVYINRILYLSAATTLTVPASDPTFDRIDEVIDSLGFIILRTGTPSLTPIGADIDPATEWLLASYPFSAGASCIDVNQITIWDENLGTPSEWAFTTSGTISANANNTDNPKHLTKAIFVSTYTNGSSLIFTAGTPLVAQAGEIFKFWVYSNGRFLNQFRVQFYNGNRRVGIAVAFNSGYGFNPLDSNVYQQVVMPFSAFGITTQTFDRVVITWSGNDISGAKGLYLDWLQLQTGITNYTDGTGVANFVHFGTDSLRLTLNNGTTFTVLDRGGSGTGGLQHVVAGFGLTNVNDSTLRADTTLMLTKLGAAAIYQPLITLTTTGSGAATFSSNILNIPTPSIPAQFNPIAGTNITLTGTYPNITFNASGGGASDTISTWAVAYVDTLGNDATGRLKNPARPFATIAAAIAALPATGGTVKIGIGSFVSPDSSQVKSYLTLIGTKKPSYNWTATQTNDTSTTYTSPTKLINGTILRGHLKFLGKTEIKLLNLGVDVGSDFSGAGVGSGGISITTSTNDTSTVPPLDLITGIEVRDCIVLGKSATSIFHDILIETALNPIVENVTTCYNTHGIVLKTVGGFINNVQCYSHSSDGIIIKSNGNAIARKVSISNFYITSLSGTEGGGLYIQRSLDSTLYAGLENVADIEVSNGQVTKCSFGVTVYRGRNTLFSNVTASYNAAAGFLIQSQANLVNCTADHNVTYGFNIQNAGGVSGDTLTTSIINCVAYKNRLTGFNCIPSTVFDKLILNGIVSSGNTQWGVIQSLRTVNITSAPVLDDNGLGKVTGTLTPLFADVTASPLTPVNFLSKVGFGVAAPISWIDIKIGTTTVSPIHFGGVAAKTTPVAGDLEMATNGNLFYTNTALGRAQLAGWFYLAKSLDYTITDADFTINYTTATAAPRTVTLLTAVGKSGRVFTIKNSSTQSITVATTSSQTIDGATTYTLATQYKYVTVQSDNANWIIIANN